MRPPRRVPAVTGAYHRAAGIHTAHAQGAPGERAARQRPLARNAQRHKLSNGLWGRRSARSAIAPNATDHVGRGSQLSRVFAISHCARFDATASRSRGSVAPFLGGVTVSHQPAQWPDGRAGSHPGRAILHAGAGPAPQCATLSMNYGRRELLTTRRAQPCSGKPQVPCQGSSEARAWTWRARRRDLAEFAKDFGLPSRSSRRT